MVMLTKRQVIMQRTHAFDTIFAVAFEGPPADPDEVPSAFESVYISNQTFTDMGSPDVITVSIQPGNMIS